jgi:hypothetical protein
MVPLRAEVSRTGYGSGLRLDLRRSCCRRIDRCRAGKRKRTCDNCRSDPTLHDKLLFSIQFIEITSSNRAGFMAANAGATTGPRSTGLLISHAVDDDHQRRQ